MPHKFETLEILANNEPCLSTGVMLDMRLFINEPDRLPSVAIAGTRKSTRSVCANASRANEAPSQTVLMIDMETSERHFFSGTISTIPARPWATCLAALNVPILCEGQHNGCPSWYNISTDARFVLASSSNKNANIKTI